YSEKALNDILKPIYEDYVLIRRLLIEYGFIDSPHHPTAPASPGPAGNRAPPFLHAEHSAPYHRALWEMSELPSNRSGPRSDGVKGTAGPPAPRAEPPASPSGTCERSRSSTS
ncbi:DUF2087 domain-containing protein, partial [Streptomyces sp. NPDC096934]|uniref:DUF2087 domain-containing protein n=1 Tax=Streptomyces sp. NPDC096934 TaxID=3155551 RepID=UPI003323BBD3